jgi:threonine aldolase
MLEVMMSAKVGDDVLGDDPTVNELEQKTAQYFGKEAGLFFPSGTMANQAGIRTHVQSGDEVICDIYRDEGGGIAANSGASVRLLNGERGVFTAGDVADNINTVNVHHAATRLVCIENTVNKGGGACWTLEQMAEIAVVCKANNLALHLDGARIWNALVAMGYSGHAVGANFNSLSVCYSKGLGCPVGSVLVGTSAFIERAKFHRKRMGGGMRQAGYLAAAGIYALENHIDRLAEDHEHAKKAYQLLASCKWVREIMPVETNIVLFRVEESKAVQLYKTWEAEGLWCNNNGKGWIRLVFHLDFKDEMWERFEEIIRSTEI